MKTAKIMVRDFGFGTVRQNHKTGWVCLTDMLIAGNAKRMQDGRNPIRMVDFFELNDTKEYLDELARAADRGELDFVSEIKPLLGTPYQDSQNTAEVKGASVAPYQDSQELTMSGKDFYKSKRGRNGGTWGHPYLAIKMAAHVDKEFEVKMHAALYDGLLSLRDAGGESFKSMCAAVDEAFAVGNDSRVYARLAWKIQEAVLGAYKKGAWEGAPQEQLKRRDKIHEAVTGGAVWAAKAGETVDSFLLGVLSRQR
jgi:hypothetical protein